MDKTKAERLTQIQLGQFLAVYESEDIELTKCEFEHWDCSIWAAGPCVTEVLTLKEDEPKEVDHATAG